MTPAYTAYARGLCPSWCTEAHEQMTDPRDTSAVVHRAVGAAVTITDPITADPEVFRLNLSRWDDLTGGDRTTHDGHVLIDLFGMEVPNELTPEDAVQVGLAFIRAAEVARRG